MKKNNQSTESIAKLIIYKIGCYIQASRLEGGIVASVFLLMGEWYSIRSFPFYSTIIAILAISGIVNTGSWINYIFDRKLDKFAKKYTDFFKYISSKELFFSSFIVLLISSALLFYVNISAFLVGLLTFLIFFVYVTPPIRLKTRPPFDIVANALGFGTLPFILGFTITGNELTLTSIIQGVIAGLPVVSYYLFIGLFDIQTDKKYGIKTSCTVLGGKGTIITGIVVFFLSIVLTILFFDVYSVLPVSLIVCSPIIFATIIAKDIMIYRVLVSCVFLVWTGAALLILSFISYSVILLFMFVVVLLLSLIIVLKYKKEGIRE